MSAVRQNMKVPDFSPAIRKLPRPKGSAANEKKRRRKYEYVEPEASVLLNQRAVWDRLKGGEKPEEALKSSASALKVRHVPGISVIVATYEPVIRYFERTLISVLSQNEFSPIAVTMPFPSLAGIYSSSSVPLYLFIVTVPSSFSVYIKPFDALWAAFAVIELSGKNSGLNADTEPIRAAHNETAVIFFNIFLLYLILSSLNALQ